MLIPDVSYSFLC